jgi:hypothetical protein
MDGYDDENPIRDHTSQRGGSQMSKLPIDISAAVNNKKYGSKAEEQNSSRSEDFDAKKFNYTKNSLNCIPLSNKFR